MKPEFLSPGSPHYPALLAERYPRILENIRQLWGTPQIQRYFSDLLLDTRDGNRQGFPFEVAAEIVRLRDMHDLVGFRAAERRQDAIELLRSEGVGITTASFLRALRKGDQKLVDLFIRAGLHLPPKDEDGVPLLIAALRNGHTVIAKMLIDAGVEVNVMDHLRLTPLLIACGKTTQGYLLITEKLIAKKADLDVRDLFGNTPLMLAISGGMFNIARLLIESGANTRAMSRKGETALDMLLVNPDPAAAALVELIRTPGAIIHRTPEPVPVPAQGLSAMKTRAHNLRDLFSKRKS